jgi:hypothetical protein
VTAKSVLRFIIGYIIAAVLMGLLLPSVGIPRAQLLPPAIVYANASAKGTGVVTKRHWRPTANPFHVGDKVYLISYAFKAKAPAILGTKGAGTVQQYTGTVKVDQSVHDAVALGNVVKVKYDPTYPVISGIDQPGFGRNGAQGSGLFSAWWLWMFLALVIGYMIAPFLERIMLRESY